MHQKLQMKKLYAIITLLTCYFFTTAQTLDKKYYVTDGIVNDIVQHGNTIYIGGRFGTVGPNTGHAALVDNVTGKLIPGMPNINGEVDAIITDGSGGWFIGGNFVRVDDEHVTNLVHIKADKSIDHAFLPQPNYTVLSLVVYNNVLYVGGNFNNIAGQTRQHAAAINMSTGKLTDWNPAPDGFIKTLAAHKGYIYMLGNFFNAGGQSRINIAAISAATGLANGFAITQNSSSGINAMALLGDTMYIGGNFTSVNGEPRNELGAVNVKTNKTTSWAPTADNLVASLYAVNNKVFVGGGFDLVNGAPHLGLAALDAVTGAVSPWNANIIGYNAVGGYIGSMVALGDTLYVAGHFKSIAGVPATNIAAIDVNTGVVTNWNPQANNNAYTLATDGTHLYLGGDFTSVNTVYRNYLAALDATTGKVTSWAPQLDGLVHGMAVKGDTVIIGGEFFKIGDSTRSWFASVDSATGEATGWAPKVFGRVYSVDVAGNTVYVAGTFSQINGKDQYDVAALDCDSATVKPWSVDLNQSLNTVLNGIKVNGKTVYLWGAFKSIGAETRNNIAAVDISTGKPTKWDPNPNSAVNVLTIVGSNIYVGGSFTNIGGQNRNGIAKLDNSAGLATTWNPNISGSYVGAIAVTKGIVYAGGIFGSAGGLQRGNLAAIDASTGSITDWKADVNYAPVNKIVPLGNELMIGGGFTQFAYYSASYLAVAGQAITLPLQLVNFTASTQDNHNIHLNWATANEANTGNFILQRAYDGVSFKDINTITAADKAFNVYSYNDTAYKTGNTLYYRLKITDKDGSVTYSNTITLNIHFEAKDFILYPNPAHGQIGLNVNSAASQKATLLITDMNGKIVQQQVIQLKQGDNNISVTLTNTAKGVYMAQLQLQEKKLTKSFITF